MKKLAGILAACMMLGSLGTTAVFAEDKVIVGEELQFAEGSGPVIINERLMLPLRAVSEALDATVYWFNDDKRIQIV
ncbi:MAG: stalk domain-containing protein, partial [Clostridia bacterium]|nr:stalk domain-containing protein [Clostridia bacterium]